MANLQPQPQVMGSAGRDPVADMQRQMAGHVAQQGAQEAQARARYGIREVKLYIQENPVSLKVMCFITGLVLMVFSILGVFNIFNAAFRPKEYMTNVYNLVFGMIICICDGKESWSKSCCDVQAKLFTYAYALATQTGRALFYFYVGSMTLLVLPDNFLWDVIYACIGGVLCLLALCMLFLQWCAPRCGCQGQQVYR
uniref:Uncharacterized protein n=1 Tax=Alexandrium catenella TaxID=2925 RepID=A0A7S1S0Q1_ALECA|mmetsp:Transcript_8110/g.22010  ORF Transcript_8110/g.22010 Transcript_8110/m.22010 type:complete len:197 (+) Transcript_8110:91-681(+)